MVEGGEIEWTPYSDLHLINSLGGLRAVGVNHNFCMVVVTHRFNSAMRVKAPLEVLRARLSTFYDFQAAEKLVGEVPFPTDFRPFELPPECRTKIDAKRHSFETALTRSNRKSLTTKQMMNPTANQTSGTSLSVSLSSQSQFQQSYSSSNQLAGGRPKEKGQLATVQVPQTNKNIKDKKKKVEAKKEEKPQSMPSQAKKRPRASDKKETFTKRTRR